MTEPEVKRVSDFITDAQFYPDVAKKPLVEALDKDAFLIDAAVITDFETEYGKSDFALMLFQDQADGTQYTVICGGVVVVRKIKELLAKQLLPLIAKLTKVGRFYDII